MSKPRPDVALACGSASSSSTFLPRMASEAARLIAVVVFPTPPFWFASAMIFAIRKKGLQLGKFSEFKSKFSNVPEKMLTFGLSNR